MDPAQFIELTTLFSLLFRFPLSLYVWVYFWFLYFVLLVHYFYPVIMPQSSLIFFLFLKDCLAILSPLHFHVEFRSILYTSTKKQNVLSLGLELHLLHRLIFSTIHEHDVSFHLFRHPFISFTVIFKFMYLKIL